MSEVKPPLVFVQLAPEFELLINGRRCRQDAAPHVAAALRRVGSAVGWARKQFGIGYEKATGPYIPTMPEQCTSADTEQRKCMLSEGHNGAHHWDRQ